MKIDLNFKMLFIIKQVMDKVKKYINKLYKSYKLYNYHLQVPEQIKYIPKYIIRTYIRRNPHKYFEIGFIYQYYYKNYERMYEYYNKAIDDANILVHLGLYYENIENDYDKMKNYYLKKDDLDGAALYLMGFYYHYYEKKYDLMQYYYMIAIKLNDTFSIFDIKYYYYQN